MLVCVCNTNGVRTMQYGPSLWILSEVVMRQILWVVGVTAVALVVLYLFFTHTILGKSLRACAVNPTAARLMGIRVERMSTLAWVIAGALGGLAGVLITPLTLATYDMGLKIGRAHV